MCDETEFEEDSYMPVDLTWDERYEHAVELEEAKSSGEAGSVMCEGIVLHLLEKDFPALDADLRKLDLNKFGISAICGMGLLLRRHKDDLPCLSEFFKQAAIRVEELGDEGTARELSQEV